MVVRKGIQLDCVILIKHKIIPMYEPHKCKIVSALQSGFKILMSSKQGHTSWLTSQTSLIFLRAFTLSKTYSFHKNVPSISIANDLLMCEMHALLFFISKDAVPGEPLLKNENNEDAKENDDSKPTEDSPTEPGSVPLDSFVVQVDNDEGEEKIAESKM